MKNPDRRVVELSLPFRGERTYLHSTSIFPACIDLYRPASAVKLEFRNLIHHPVYLSEDDIPGVDAAGRFSFRTDKGVRNVGIYVDEGKVVSERVACIEKRVVEAATRDGDTASGEIGRPGNFIETAVSLNKALVAGHVEPSRKIIFSAIAIDHVPDEGRIGVALKKRLGTKLFVSDISHNDAKIGTLTFMAV